MQRLLQHRLADDQLPYQIENVVDSPRFHSQNVFGHRDLDRTFLRGSRLFGLLRRCKKGFFRRTLIHFGRRQRLRFEMVGDILRQLCGFFLFSRGDQGDGDFARNRRYADFGRNLTFGVRTGEHEFHLLGGRGGFCIGPCQQHVADGADRVLNQLPRGNRHGAVRIDFHYHFIQRQPGCASLNHRPFFGLGPVFAGFHSGFGALPFGSRFL